MKLRAILLFLMISFEFLLHLNLLDKVNIPYVSTIIPAFIYGVWFWIIYLGIEVIFMITLLGSGTTVKTKNITETHIYQDKEEIARLNKELEEIKKSKEIKE